MRPEIRRRFQELIDNGKKKQSPSKPTRSPKPQWQLWRWDTLEDVDQGD